MKKTLSIAAALTLAFSVALWAHEVKLGAPVTLKESTPIHELLANPAKYVGKEVRVEGEITSVCQSMGCWIKIKDAKTGAEIQVKVEDGVIVFPKESAGWPAVAQGILEKVEATTESHTAQPAAGAKAKTGEAKEGHAEGEHTCAEDAKATYRLKGLGAVLTHIH